MSDKLTGPLGELVTTVQELAEKEDTQLATIYQRVNRNKYFVRRAEEEKKNWILVPEVVNSALEALHEKISVLEAENDMLRTAFSANQASLMALSMNLEAQLALQKQELRRMDAYVRRTNEDDSEHRGVRQPISG